jgi:hypothetical protein
MAARGWGGGTSAGRGSDSGMNSHQRQSDSAGARRMSGHLKVSSEVVRGPGGQQREGSVGAAA